MHNLDREAPSLLNEAASASERRFSLGVVIALGGASLVALPFHGRAHPSALFIPVFATTTGTADALAALLLFSLYHIDGSRLLLATAAAYLINALLIIPYAVTFPGVIDAHGFIGNEQSAGWLWALWHTTFPFLVAIGSLGGHHVHERRQRSAYIAAAIVACTCFAALATLGVTLGRGALPILLQHGRFSPIFTTFSTFASFASITVVVLLLRGAKPTTILCVWVCVALTASALDTLLNAVTSVRFSAAWYIGKVETFISASVVLVSLMALWSTLYTRSTTLAQRLATTVADGKMLQERLTREHEIAAALQQASLPGVLPQLEGVTLHATYRPALGDLKVGGDWYDAFELADGRLAITIGDVAGHGLAASIVMSKLRQSLRLAALMLPDPKLMLAISDMALRSEHPDTIATAFVAVLDRVTGRLTWACAGHPPAMIRQRDGSIQELCRPAPPLGIYSAAAVPTNALTLEPMSLLVAYTDGLVEAGKDIIAGLSELRALLAQERFLGDPQPAETLFETIVGDRARDDVAVITLAFDGVPDRPRAVPLVPDTHRLQAPMAGSCSISGHGQLAMRAT